MHAVLSDLNRPALESLATDLESGRLSPPYNPSRLHGYAPESLCRALCLWLEARHQEGLSAVHAAMMLRLVAEERRSTQAARDRAQLVWSGVETTCAKTRDTRIVVQELFARARRCILISSFALDYGERGCQLFAALARRMDSEPELEVKLYVNVNRPHGDTSPSSDLLREFSERFRNHLWAGHRLPDVFYYPESLETTVASKKCLHAKCVVIDGEQAFITSANFTEAAQDRNIEAGILMTDPQVARGLQAQFEILTANRVLKKLP